MSLQLSPTKTKHAVQQFLIYFVLTLGAIVMVTPFVWMVSTSLKGQEDLFTWPLRFIPQDPTIQPYLTIWKQVPMAIYFYNSAIVAIAVTGFNLFFDSLAAYTFAKRTFPGRDIIFLLILATLMIPGQVTMIPAFLILKSVPFFGGNNWLGQGGTGWLNTYWGLIVPGAASGFGIFLLRQFMLGIPNELLDAARIDGCSEFTTYWRIILPLSKPALAALAIFTFNGVWNEFLWPLIITSSTDMRTLPVGLALFVGKNQTDWGGLLAASIVATLPIIIVFFTAQKQFIQGITLTGLKG